MRMFKKKDKFERHRVDISKLPESAQAKIKQTVMSQFLMMLWQQAYEWTSADRSRSFELAHDPDGLFMRFMERGVEVVPDFMVPKE